MRALVLLVWCMLAIAPALHLPKLSFSNDEWLPPDNPHHVALEGFRDEFEPDETFLVAIPLEQGFFNSTQIDRIEALEEALDALDVVQSVLSPLSGTVIIDTGETLEIGSFINALENKYINNINSYRDKFLDSHYAGKLLSPDEHTVLLRVAIERTDEESRAIAVATVKQVVQAHGYDGAHFAGESALKNELNHVTREELPVLLGYAVLMLALFLFLLCGDWRRATLILITAGVAISASLGIMGYFGWPMSVILLMLPVMISIIAVADALHILANWDAHAKLAPNERLMATIRNSWLPCLGATLTSAVGFGALVTSELVPLHHFGAASALSIVYAYPLITGAIWGALFLFPQLARVPSQRFDWSACAAFIERIVLKRTGYVAIVSLLVAAGLGAGLSMIRTETNFLSVFFSEEQPIREAFDLVDDELGGSGRVEVILRSEEEYYGTLEGMRVLDQLSRQAAKIDTVNHADSYLLPVNIADEAFGGAGLPQTDEELSQELLFLSLSRSETERGVVEPYLDFNYTNARLSLQTPNLNSLPLGETLVKVTDLTDALTINTTVTGFGVFIHNLGEYVLQTQAVSILITLLIISTILLIRFGLVIGFCACLANLFPLVITTGLVAWLGYPYDFATILIAGVTLGLSVDDTFHFLHHYLQGEREGGNRLSYALERTLRPIAVTTLLFCLGLGVIAFSNLVVLERFAIFTAFGIVAALIAVLITLPAMIFVIIRQNPITQTTRR